jgi:hypothetical protein
MNKAPKDHQDVVGKLSSLHNIIITTSGEEFHQWCNYFMILLFLSDSLGKAEAL